ncbi:MAG: tetratricopeptide repeat protein, partial [Elusimicrobia bacterium]|nr:tetratricopeptide repeat protein [Elusimicrobiota bacterium]
IGAIWFFARSSVLNNPSNFQAAEAVKSVAANSPAILSYLGKLFFPVRLSVFPVRGDIMLWPGVVALFLLAALFISSKQRRTPLAVFGTAWFLLFIVPSLAIPDTSSSQYLMYHRAYVSSLGLGLLLASVSFPNFPRRVLRSAGAVVLVLFAGLSFVHSKHFKDRLSFWKNAADTSPHSAFARNNLGVMLFLDGRHVLADKVRGKAVELDAAVRLVHGNLGLLLMNRGDLAGAEEEYKKELLLNPRYDNVHYNLGLLYHRQGKAEEAVDLWNRTLELNPNYADAYANLIIHFIQTRDLKQAAAYYKRAAEKGLALPKEIVDFFDKMRPTL